MLLYELIELINDNSIVIIYDQNQNKLACYDGKESIPEEFNEFEVWDIFPDIYKFTNKNVPAIGVEVEVIED